MNRKPDPLPPALQEYLATRARERGFADASDYLRALIRQQRAGQPQAPDSPPLAPAEPVAAADFERLRDRLEGSDRPADRKKDPPRPPLRDQPANGKQEGDQPRPGDGKPR